MTDQHGKIGSHRLRPALVASLLALAVGVGVGTGALLVGAVGTAASVSPSSTPGTASASGVPSTAPADVGPAPAPTPRPTPTPEPTPALVPGPLTGLLVTAEEALKHPIAVMVDDHRAARPQSGFNAAAQVWQAPAESGIPRYMLVFQDSLPAAVGPIRSARQYFVEWAAEWTAMFVHVGGAPDALATLRAGGSGQLVFDIQGFRFEGTDMWRVADRRSPHNVYTDADHLRAMAAKVGATDGQVERSWTFAEAAQRADRPTGTTLTVHYPYETVTYRYDPVSNAYARFIDQSPTQQIDAADGRPVWATNVVILRMRFGELHDGHPEKQRLEAEDVGSGEAIISTNGRVFHGTWKKAALDAPTLLFGPSGTPITLTAGQTYVQVIDLSSAYEVVEGTFPRSGIMAR